MVWVGGMLIGIALGMWIERGLTAIIEHYRRRLDDGSS